MEECVEEGGQDELSVFGVGLNCIEVRLCLVISEIFLLYLKPGRQIDSFCRRVCCD